MTKGRPGYLGATATAGLFLALALAGCTPTDGGADTQEEAVAAAPAEETTSRAEESQVPADEPDSDEPEPADPPAAGGDCLVGEWTIAEAELQQFYGSVSSQANFTIVGDVALSFTEDTFEYLPDFVMEMEIAGQEAEGVVVATLPAATPAPAA